MKSEDFLRVVGDIDDDLILEAHRARRAFPRTVRVLGTLAACLVLVLGTALAAPMFFRTMKDAAAENEAMPDGGFYYTADDAADVVVEDEKQYYATLADQAKPSSGAASDRAPAETNAAAETVQSTSTAQPQPLAGRTFWFYDGKTWRTETKTYPGGLPSMQVIVNDYLAAAGVKVQCTDAHREVDGEKDEVKNGIVTHTVGVCTWTITLDGAVTDAVFRGLVNTVLESETPSPLYLVQADTPAGRMGPAQAGK